jgi:hypothetical protein
MFRKLEKIGCVEHPSLEARARALSAEYPCFLTISAAALIIVSLSETGFLGMSFPSDMKNNDCYFIFQSGFLSRA